MLTRSQVISWIHIVVGISLLIWLKVRASSSLSSSARNTILIIGASVMAYHLYLFRSRGSWIYLLHALIVAPIIVYFALSPKNGASVLSLLAIVMVVYHAMRLFP